MATFDHDRMPAYRVARELNAGCSRMISKLGAGRGDLADQLRRAAASVALNLAEGAGEFAPREKARFYRMARRSGTECAAVLDALVDTGQIAEGLAAPLREKAATVVAMLVLLVKAMEQAAKRQQAEPGNRRTASADRLEAPG